MLIETNLLGTNVLVAFMPQSGPISTDVLIFDPEGGNLSASKVFFNNVETFQFTNQPDGTILAKVPAGASTGKIKLQIPLVGTVTSQQNFTVSSVSTFPTPSISSFSPVSGGLNTDITVFGSNLENVFQATIGGAFAQVLSAFSNQVIIRVASQTSGQITLTSEAGSATSAQGFSFLGGSNTSPTITGFSPTSGPLNTDISVFGNNLGSTTAATIGGQPAQVVSASAGNVVIRAINNASGVITLNVGGTTVSSQGVFSLTGSGGGGNGLTISNFSPTSGGVNTQIILTGSNLGSVNSATIGGAAAQVVSVLPSQVIIKVLSSVSGPITLSSETGNVTTAGSFTVTGSSLPALTGFSPTAGGLNTLITVFGSNLGSTSAASIGGRSVQVVSVTPSQVVLKVTVETSGTITLSGASGSVTSATAFTFFNSGGGGIPSAPVITSFSPASGPLGTRITVQGQNFTNTATAAVGNLGATLEFISANSVVVTVPMRAASGPIKITTEGGTVQSAGIFTVTSGTLPPPPTGNTGIEIDVQGINAFQPVVDNEIPPRFGGATGATTGSLSLISGQDLTIRLVAKNNLFVDDLVTLKSTPNAFSGLVPILPALPVMAFTPFNLTIDSSPQLPNGFYEFLVDGKGSVPFMLQYDGFLLSVAVMAAAVIQFPNKSRVSLGTTTVVPFKVIRRRFATPLNLIRNTITTNLPDEISVDIRLVRSELNTDGTGGTADFYEARFMAPPMARVGTFDFFLTSQQTEVFVENELKAFQIDVDEDGPVKIINQPTVLEKAAGSTFDLEFAIISNSFTGSVSVNALPPRKRDSSPEPSVTQKAPTQIGLSVMPQTEYPVKFTYTISASLTETMLELPIQVEYNDGRPRKLETFVNLNVLAREVLVSGLPEFSLFDTETRNINISATPAVLPDGRKISIRVSAIPSSLMVDVPVNPVEANSQTNQATFTFTGTASGIVRSETLSFNPVNAVGNELQVKLLRRKADKFLRLSAGSTQFGLVPLTVTLSLPSNLSPTPFSRFDAVNPIDIIVVDSLGNNVSQGNNRLIDLRLPDRASNLFLDNRKTSLDFTVAAIQGITPSGNYTVMVTGRLGSRAVTFKASLVLSNSVR